MKIFAGEAKLALDDEGDLRSTKQLEPT